MGKQLASSLYCELKIYSRGFFFVFEQEDYRWVDYLFFLRERFEVDSNDIYLVIIFLFSFFFRFEWKVFSILFASTVFAVGQRAYNLFLGNFCRCLQFFLPRITDVATFLIDGRERSQLTLRVIEITFISSDYSRLSESPNRKCKLISKLKPIYFILTR